MIPHHTKRYLKIILTLFRHGSGWLVLKLGIGTMLPFHWGLLGHPRREEPYSAPEHLRMAFEELGPTFIKLGQILSTRPDLISPEYAEEFSRLQDRISPLPFEDIKSVLEEEFGEPYEKTFSQFETKAVSSASIGQVYRAVLHSGQKVIVKVQKPGLLEQIQNAGCFMGSGYKQQLCTTPCAEKGSDPFALSLQRKNIKQYSSF